MPLQLAEENGGNILAICVSGKLTKADYATLEPQLDRMIRLPGKVRLLFDMADFHGWEIGAAWEDLKLGVAHFADIERIAMIGETKWQQGMATFCQPFTKAAVRYFDRADAADARKWLRAAQ